MQSKTVSAISFLERTAMLLEYCVDLSHYHRTVPKMYKVELRFLQPKACSHRGDASCCTLKLEATALSAAHGHAACVGF